MSQKKDQQIHQQSSQLDTEQTQIIHLPGKKTRTGKLGASQSIRRSASGLRYATRPPRSTAPFHELSVLDDVRVAASRDSNNVAAGAEAKVNMATSSTGAGLPSRIQRKFEASLGADLSGVRLHTGAASASAASAVGAKAYAIGNDIHFATGEFQPSSQTGQHLLAHEVAHTVQQTGGNHSMQCKLEVSSPNDWAELEADHAADAMVMGATAQVSAVTGTARYALHRYDGAGGAPSHDSGHGGAPSHDDGYDNGQSGAYDSGAGGAPSHNNGQGGAYNSNDELEGAEGNSGDSSRYAERDRYEQEYEQAQESAAKPDPNCPMEGNPVSWDVGPVQGPAEPSPWTSDSCMSQDPPLPDVRPDGRPSSHGVRPIKITQSQTAGAAFESAWAGALSSFNAIVPGVTGFNNASRDFDALGLGPDLHNWKNSKTPKNGHELASEQLVGPDGKDQNQAAKVKVKDLFKDGGSELDVDFSQTKKSGDLDAKFKAAMKTAEENVVEAMKGYTKVCNTVKGAADKVRTAALKVAVVTAEMDVEEREAANKALVGQRAAALATVDTTVKVISDVISLVSAATKTTNGLPTPDAAGVTKAGVSLIGTAAKAMISANYEGRIKATAAQVASAKGIFAGAKAQLVTTEFDAAADAYSRLVASDPWASAKTSIRQAVRARDEAYRQFASEAAKHTDDPEASARVQAAIQAIPICEAALAQIKAVTGSIALPSYTVPSGYGFKAARQPAALPKHIGYLKGYKDSFQPYETGWTERLTGVQQAAKGLNSKA